MRPGIFDLPIQVLVRGADYDDTTHELRLSTDSDWPGVIVDGVKCHPLFTTYGAVSLFIPTAGSIDGGKYAKLCDAALLLMVIETFRPNGIVIDPLEGVKQEDVLDTGIVLAWLRGEAE